MIPRSMTFPVTSHTEAVQPGGVFVAIPGHAAHGAAFVSTAIARGATTVVLQKDDAGRYGQLCSSGISDGVRYVLVPCARRALARYAARAAGHPAEKLTIIGVTGSKGKTITTSLIAHLLRSAGHAVATLGALGGNKTHLPDAQPFGTPASDYLHPFFADCVEQGITHVVMEVSAHALSLYRVHGVPFSHVVLTNFSPDHCDFFGSVPRYLNIKKRLFKQCTPGGRAHLLAGRVCDELHEVLPEDCSLISTQFDRATQNDQLVYDVLDDSLNRLELVLHEGQKDVALTAPPLGRFNAPNIVLAASVARSCGLSWQEIVPALAHWPGAPGRLQRHTTKRGVTVVTDTAHEPSTVDEVLGWLRQNTDHLTVVLGCRGNRDVTARVPLAAAVARHADAVVLTADQSPSQDSLVTINQIKAGIEAQAGKQVRLHIELDRAAAIEKACKWVALAHGVVAILGNGVRLANPHGASRDADNCCL